MSVVIDKIKDTDIASADTFNKPLYQIESALNKLQDTLYNMSSKSCIVYNNAPVSSDCFIGALVYLDEYTHIMRPARAVCSTQPVSSGKYIDSPESHVVGMVINIKGSLADVLIQGSYDSDICVTGCGITDGPGTYYLAENEAGKCTKNPPEVMKTPVLTYMGGSSIILNITSRPPYQYDSPLIRGIVSDDASIAVSADYSGIGHINMADSVATETALSPTAVSSISGRFYTKTPIVSSISGVGGIKATTNNLGETILELTSEIGGVHYAEDYNLNGTKRVSDEVYTYIVFPKGKESRLTISTPINVSRHMTATPWAHVISSESLDIAARSFFMPDPSIESGVNISDIDWITDKLSVEGNDGNLVLSEAASGVPVYGQGNVITTFTVSGVGADIRLLRAGVKLTPVSNISDNSFIDTASLQSSAIADTSIEKDSLVGLTVEGRLINVSCDDPGIPVVGIAVNSVEAGEVCKYTSSGYHHTDIALKHGSSYFVGLNGKFTNAIPDIPNYAQRIGEAVNVNILRIDIEERII